jgi:hypothetical protein
LIRHWIRGVRPPGRQDVESHWQLGYFILEFLQSWRSVVGHFAKIENDPLPILPK